MEKTPIYTTIIHKIRIDLDLTCNEYCVADLIHALSSNPDSKIRGWCWASRQFIGNFLGISRRGAEKIIFRLIEKGFIEKDEETKYLKATSKWYAVTLERIKLQSTDSEQSSQGANKVPKDSEQSSKKVEQSSTYNNTYKEIDKNAAFAPLKENSLNSGTPAPSVPDWHVQTKELFDYYIDLYQKMIAKEKPIFAWGKCEKNVKPYLNQLGLEKMKKIIKGYLTEDNKFYREVSWSLENMLAANQINTLNIKYGRK